MTLEWLLDNWYVTDFNRDNAKKLNCRREIYVAQDKGRYILFKKGDKLGYSFPDEIEATVFYDKKFWIKSGKLYLSFNYRKFLLPTHRFLDSTFGIYNIEKNMWKVIKFGNSGIFESEEFECECYKGHPWITELNSEKLVVGADEKCVRKVFEFDVEKLRIRRTRSIFDCGMRNCYDTGFLKFCD